MNIYAPLRVERFALRRARTPVVRTGMGPSRVVPVAGPALVAGLGGGLGADVRPGDVVVATEVRGPDRTIACPSAPILAGELRRAGLTVHLGPIVSVPRIATGSARRRLAETGALAVDMESAFLAPPDGEPFAVVRSISDTDREPLLRPGIVPRGIRALRNLARTVPALDAWADALGPREVTLAIDEADEIAAVLRGRFPAMAPPTTDDICYATTNRQRAVRATARDCDLILVLGSANSSNSLRRVEVAERDGVPARLIDDPSCIDLAVLAGAARIGIAAGASAPPHLVDDLVTSLRGLGPTAVTQASGESEDLRFTLPKEVC